MAKLNTKTAALKQLHELVQKQAALAQTNISGVPGKDTNVSSISEGTETTNQNAVGPEELNGKQGPEQKPAKDEAEPLAGAKSAAANEELNKAAADILDLVRNSIKEGKAQTNISGVPGKDTKVESVSEGTETTNQNAVGPEELNGKQGPEQKPSKDDAAPLKTAAAFGKSFFEALTKRAEVVRKESEEQNRYLMCKAAGRADLETLVNHALQELEVQKQAQAAEQEKVAEAAGAEYFDNIYAEAAREYAEKTAAAELVELKAKIAALEAKTAAVAPTPPPAAAAPELDAVKIAQLVIHELQKSKIQ